ncbi:hypothetical protein DL93DRAFT_2223018 [Clavulina sp. PMI_390]|nr:hypothetical protein DL93DRAFT_2223018 [Clavulina sp. PMI_390]
MEQNPGPNEASAQHREATELGALQSNVETVSLSEPISGHDWLQKVSLDVVDAIVSWLDPLSSIRFGNACKAFRSAVGDDRPLWYRALRDVAAKHYVAPRSLDHVRIVSELRRFSTRPDRLLEAFKDINKPLRATVREFVLDHGNTIPFWANDDDRPVYLAPILLPGGRWLLSGVLNYEKLSTQLYCWDCMKPHSDNSPLQPVATYTWDGWQPRMVKRGWLQAQPDGPNAITLSCSLWGRNLRDLTHDILRMSWNSDPGSQEPPVIEQVARMDHDFLYTGDDHPQREYDLEGDYVIIETTRCILVWNWRENLIGVIDDAQHEWANGTGFLLATVPPYLFVIPHELEEILVMKIPKLHAMDTSYEPIRPTSITSHPFLQKVEGLTFSSLFVLDRWVPPSSRSGTLVLRSHRETGGSLQQIISLHHSEETPPVPSHATQEEPPITHLQPEVIDSMTVVDGVGALILESFPETDTDDDGHATVKNTMDLDARFYPFLENGGFGEVVIRVIRVSYPYANSVPCKGFITNLCFVSGTAMIKTEHCFVREKTQAVGIVYFD